MYLCTDNFTVPDVVRLMNVLLVKYEIPGARGAPQRGVEFIIPAVSHGFISEELI